MTERAAVEDALRAAGRFRFEGGLVAAEPYGPGHINDTFLVRCSGAQYILQRINPDVFPDFDPQMGNIARVLDHLRAKEPDPRRLLTLIRTEAGSSFLREDGAVWRAYAFIEGGRTLRELDISQAREAAAAFGRFQRRLSDLPPPRLFETLPGFHDTTQRLRELDAARRANPLGRSEEGEADLGFAWKHERLTEVLSGPAGRGELPERVVHNDTKADNVLFDAKTGEALCVVDLDTVMPGLSLNDFGDLVRSVVSAGREDDPGGGGVRLDVFQALAEGYLAETGDMLSVKEAELLPLAPKVIAYELGMRFLADYLQGDTYFKTSRPGQNLDRCRAQFRLVDDLVAVEPDLVSIVRSI